MPGVKESIVKRERNERSHKDPVCGMAVSPSAAVDQFTHEDKAYYFCCGACRETFEAEPDRYIRSHRQHGARSE